MGRIFLFFYPNKIVWHTTHRTKFAFKCGTNIALCFYFSKKKNKKNLLFLSFGFSFDFINYSVDYLILLHLFLFSASLQLLKVDHSLEDVTAFFSNSQTFRSFLLISKL